MRTPSPLLPRCCGLSRNVELRRFAQVRTPPFRQPSGLAVNENEIPHVTHALTPSCGWWTRGGLFTWRFEICGASDSPGIGRAEEDVAKPLFLAGNPVPESGRGR